MLAAFLLLVALNFAKVGPGFSMAMGVIEIVPEGDFTEAGLRRAIVGLICQL